MYVQRFVTIIISLITIVPLYFLGKKFFDRTFALIGSALFVFEPRIIQNSLLGITEPLFILLGIITLVLFLNERLKIVYVSFATLALFSLGRYEGLLLIIPISIIFFIRYRTDKKVVLKYALCISIFILVLLPMAYVRIQTTGTDGLTSHIIEGVNVATNEITSENPVGKFSLMDGLFIFGKLFSWSTFPIYFLFIPIGTILILKNKTWKNYMIVICCIVLLMPSLYAFSRGFEETKYLLIITPFFSLISLFSIQYFYQKSKKNSFFVLLLIGIAASSFLFLSWKTDNQYEREAVIIAEEVAKRTTIINDYHPESVYLRTVGFTDFDEFKGKGELIHNKIKVLFAEKFNSLNEFLSYGQSEGLEYLLVDDKNDRPQFLIEVFKNEENYPYLTKDFDSADLGFKYHVKIFKINYELMH